MSSSRPPNSNQPNSSNTATAPPSFTEYKLKMSPMAVSHNVMALHSTSAKLTDFTQPIRMFRDKESALIQEAPKAAETPVVLTPSGAVKLPVGGSKAVKKKTRVIYQGDEDNEDEHNRETESVPWLLEDYDGQHSFVGKLEGGQRSNYVFFVNQGDEFRIIPVNKWYRFQPKLSYHTLSIEEAETQMAAKNKDEIGRWLMKNRNKPDSGSTSPTTAKSNSMKVRLAEKVINAELEADLRAQNLRSSQAAFYENNEEVDFDEIFDDDEGNDGFGSLREDAKEKGEGEVTGDSPLKKKNYKLSSEGRAVKRIVKHLDKSNEIIYASDEENDPYASDNENYDEDDEEDVFEKLTMESNEAQKSKVVPVPGTSSSSQSSKPSSTSMTKNITSASKSATPSQSLTASTMSTPTASRAVSPIGSPAKRSGTSSTSTAVKKSKTSLSDDDEDAIIITTTTTTSSVLITESELVGHLRLGPLSTKDLIAKFKRQLKADVKNKDIFRELVRKVAMVRPSGNGEDDKLLELKPEFKN